MHPTRLSFLLLAATTGLIAQTPAPQPTDAPIWQMQDSGSMASLRGIDSVDGTVAWASGTEGTVLKTTDGGAHWTRCAVPDGNKDGATLDFRGVQAFDANTAIVMASGPGDKSRLYKTTDGCKTWKLLFSNPDSPDGFFDSFWLNPHGNPGIVLGDPVKHQLTVFETTDQGMHWKRDNDAGLNIGDRSVGGFAASNQLLWKTRSWFGYGFVVGGKSGSLYFHKVSEDGKWQAASIPLFTHSESAGPFALAWHRVFPQCTDCNPSEGGYLVAVGGDYVKPQESNGTAARSTDDGEHWSAAIKPPHGYRSTVQWSTTEKLWITAGTNGSDISRDDGRTWQPLDNGNWNALSLPFIVGPKGRIAKLDPSALPKP